MNTIMAFAMYKPFEGKEEDLLKLIEQHLPTLKEYELVTDRDSYLAKSKNGTFIEVFEWVNEKSKDHAHEHPAVAKIWEKMTEVSDFKVMNDLEEAGMQFPNFHIVALQ